MDGNAFKPRIALTIYNRGTALVREKRIVSLKKGVNIVTIREVPSSIETTSVHFQSLLDPVGTRVLEQRYTYDLADTDALLRRYLGKTVTVTTRDGVRHKGKLLGYFGGITLQDEGGHVIALSRDAADYIEFPALPEGLSEKPGLIWQVWAEKSGDHEIELSYLTGGINWQADYTALINEDETALDLEGWVTIENSGDATYDDAAIKLVAGDISRAPKKQSKVMAMEVTRGATPAPAPEEPVEEQELLGYHLYKVPRPVTIRPRESIQLDFVSLTGSQADMSFLCEPGGVFTGYRYPLTNRESGIRGKVPVSMKLEFKAETALPAGRIRVYKRDADGTAILVGESRIGHTPEGENLKLHLGNAFDLIGERSQIDFKMPASNVIEETIEIRLRNRKENQAVGINVRERLFRWSNWTILKASDDWEKLDAATIEFRPKVEPGTEHIITYTVRYRWPKRK